LTVIHPEEKIVLSRFAKDNVIASTAFNQVIADTPL
jgi:hypothetical protein